MEKEKITNDIINQYKDALHLKKLNQELYDQLCGSILYLLKYSQKYDIPLPKKELLLGMIKNAESIIEQFAESHQPTGNTNKKTDNETAPNKR